MINRYVFTRSEHVFEALTGLMLVRLRLLLHSLDLFHWNPGVRSHLAESITVRHLRTHLLQIPNSVYDIGFFPHKLQLLILDFLPIFQVPINGPNHPIPHLDLLLNLRFLPLKLVLVENLLFGWFRDLSYSFGWGERGTLNNKQKKSHRDDDHWGQQHLFGSSHKGQVLQVNTADAPS